MNIDICAYMYFLERGEDFPVSLIPNFPPFFGAGALSSKVEVWVSVHLMAGFTGSLFPFPSPSAHPSAWPFASSLWMLCFSSDLWFPVGLEECEAGVVFCFVTSEQKGKQGLVVTGLAFWGGLQTDSKALGRIRTTLWWQDRSAEGRLSHRPGRNQCSHCSHWAIARTWVISNANSSHLFLIPDDFYFR